MNPTAIYSKSGKGVQEAAGKTSLLKRGDRAVLSAIDGRATLADVAQKVGKTFDREFEQLVTQLDKDGFVREVSSGTASAAKPAFKPAAKPAAPTAPMDAGSDLDFSSFAPPPKPASPPPKPSFQPASPPPKAAPAAAAPAKDQQSALNKAREEAEAKGAAEREKQKAEAEAAVRAELEATMRAEAEEKAKEAAANKGKADAAARLQAEADAKIKAARDTAVRAAAEAKAKADAEAKRVREADEMKQRLDAERRRREEEEEQARRRQREEEERKAEEEREARRKQREEEDRKAEEEREARRKQREEEQRLTEEEERRQDEERTARRKQEQEERRKREEAEVEAEAQARAAQKKSTAEAKPAASGGSFSDSLLSDLDSFGKRDEEERKEKEQAERKAKAEEAKRRAREEEERREREEEEEKESKRRAKEEAKRKEREQEEALEREEEEAKQRKRKEKEQARRKEEEEAKHKEEEEAKHKEDEEKKRKKAKQGGDDDIPITDEDLGTDDLRRDQRELARAAQASPRPKESQRVKLPPPVSGPSLRRKPVKWGRPVSIVLFLLLAGGLGVAHVMPIDIGGYERSATEALGRPVTIGSGRLWLFGGSLQLKLQGVTVGDSVKIANVNAFPAISSLSGEKKVFNRIELEGLTLPQEAVGDALFARPMADNFSVERIVVRQLELTGPLVLPKGLEADIALDASGAPLAVTVRGPDGLVAKLTPKDSAVDVEVNAGGFTLPIAPAVTFSSFGMKGSATRQGMQIEKWDGTLLNGNIVGTANVRWGGTWSVDGVFTMRGINAAVFAPTLLSEGRGEGTAKFQLNGADPAKLASGGRFEGNFTVNKGVLGSFDLSRALQTGGKQAGGRTPFNEMTGHAVYNAGTVALRNVAIAAGSMNAGASADIAQSGALSGRIVADVRTPNQMLRATINIGGTVKDPQVKN